MSSPQAELKEYILWKTGCKTVREWVVFCKYCEYALGSFTHIEPTHNKILKIVEIHICKLNKSY